MAANISNRSKQSDDFLDSRWACTISIIALASWLLKSEFREIQKNLELDFEVNYEKDSSSDYVNSFQF